MRRQRPQSHPLRRSRAAAPSKRQRGREGRIGPRELFRACRTSLLAKWRLPAGSLPRSKRIPPAVRHRPRNCTPTQASETYQASHLCPGVYPWPTAAAGDCSTQCGRETWCRACRALPRRARRPVARRRLARDASHGGSGAALSCECELQCSSRVCVGRHRKILLHAAARAVFAAARRRNLLCAARCLLRHANAYCAPSLRNSPRLRLRHRRRQKGRGQRGRLHLEAAADAAPPIHHADRDDGASAERY